GSTLIAVGLGVAAAGFAGRYAFHLWKPLGQAITQTARKFPSTAFSSHYYKGGFEQKMTKREASLILGISPTSAKSKVREAHRRIMVLNHPDK
ncbi:dnaJ subfamily C member 15, partial [Clarias magur]